MDHQIDAAIKRARAYWFVDGIGEILLAVIFLVLGFAVWLAASTPRELFFTQFAPLLAEITILKLAGVILAVVVLWWVKNHFTYPRTGLVRGKRITAGQVLMLCLAAIFIAVALIAVLGVLFVLVPGMGRILPTLPFWLPALMGVFWAGLCCGAGLHFGLMRFRWLALITLLLGIAVGVWQAAAGTVVFPMDAMPAGSWDSWPQDVRFALAEIITRALAAMGAMSIAEGILFLLAGKITLLRYLRANPKANREVA